MKIKQSILILIVFVFLSINVFGQDATNEKSAPKDILSTEIEFGEFRDVTSLDLFSTLSLFEIKIGYVEAGTGWLNRFNISGAFTVRDFLTFLVAQDSRYFWIEEKGVINFLPIEEPPILKVQIPRFKVAKSNTIKIIQALLDTDEVKNAALKNGLIFRGVSDIIVTCGNIDRRETREAKPESGKKDFLVFENLTVRQILNEINRLSEAKGHTWKYVENRIVDDGGIERNYFYIKTIVREIK